MNQNQPPKVPQSSSKGTSKVYGICTAIALCGVILSGVSAYVGSNLANQPISNQISQNNQIASGAQSSNGQSSISAIDVSQVVEKVKPTVVEITTEVVSSGNSIFQQYVSEGAGSGVILSSDGYIVTNDHVVQGSRSISVKLYDGSTHQATLVGSDSQTDIAVLKIDAKDLVAATMGNSDEIKVGEPAIAVGNPLGSLGGTVTTGVISAVGREITIESETMTLLQTDAAINPGNSGGGLFDQNGNLIGIVNAKQSASGIEGLGFAIPVTDVQPIIEELKTNGEVTNRPALNFSLREIPANSYFNFNTNEPMEAGVYVAQVVKGGAADQAGIQEGDRILKFDGKEVTSVSQLKNDISKKSVGDKVTLEIERDGKTSEVTATLQSKASK